MSVKAARVDPCAHQARLAYLGIALNDRNALTMQGCDDCVDARQCKRMQPERSLRGKVGEEGFTLIEVMIALLLLLIGVAGVLSLQMVSVKATGYSRHATEATILGEDKMEELFSVAAADLIDGTDTVDSDGVGNAAGLYTRTWTIASAGTIALVTVGVTWQEKGAESHTITLATQRRL